MATVWNPADKTASISLSNTNHTAVTTVGGNEGVRATPTYHGASGKWYLEYTGITFGAGNSCRWGFADAGLSLGTATGVMGVDTAGNVNGGAGSMGSSPAGKTVCIAMDFDNKRMWARYDGGSWVGNGGSADPAANTNGLDISTGFTLPVIPYTRLQFAGTGTLNCGDSAFVQAVPSGFLGWDAPPPPVSYGQVIC